MEFCQVQENQKEKLRDFQFLTSPERAFKKTKYHSAVKADFFQIQENPK